MSEIRVEPSAIEDAPGVEALLQIAMQGQQGGREWGECAINGRLAAEQRGMAAAPLGVFTQRGGGQVAHQPAYRAAPFDPLRVAQIERRRGGFDRQPPQALIQG